MTARAAQRRVVGAVSDRAFFLESTKNARSETAPTARRCAARAEQTVEECVLRIKIVFAQSARSRTTFQTPFCFFQIRTKLDCSIGCEAAAGLKSAVPYA